MTSFETRTSKEASGKGSFKELKLADYTFTQFSKQNNSVLQRLSGKYTYAQMLFSY